jgi:HAD superfamily hydrolase (TIGR01509 family)
VTLDLDGIRAVLLDVDGTLVDTNYVHAVCWSDAFADHGVARPTADLHQLIGMESDRLIDTALSDAPPSKQLREDLKRRHGELYEQHWSRLRPLPGARELLHQLADRGLITALVSSAPEKELSVLRKALDADDWIEHATTGDDAEDGKPAPDLVETALSKAGCDPQHALMIGDSRWDAEAAHRAGVRFVGLTCGGTSEADLVSSGAVAVFPDPGFLLAHLG